MEMYDAWNVQKKEIESTACKSVFFREGDILFIHIGKNIGCEQDGKGKTFKRPVVILKKFNNGSFLGVPLTSQSKQTQDARFYFKFFAVNIVQIAVLSQIRLFSSKRLMTKIGRISSEDFKNLRQKIKDLL